MSRNKLFIVPFAVSMMAAVLSAQAPPGGGRGGRGPAAGQTVEKIRQLKPNLYMITGGGANTLIRVTPEGLIVVDTKNPSDENYNRVERRYGSFSRSLTLPKAADGEKIEAVFDKGVLRIEVPKVEAAKPKKITVKASA